MNKNIVITIIAIVIVGAGAFFGGMKYQQSQRSTGQGQGGNFVRRFGQNAQAVRGQIVASDSGTLTIKMRDGSTKLVILSSSTNITKAASGTRDDLKAGSQVMVFGNNNSDGSVTAQVVQLNPMFTGAGRTGTGQ